MINHDPAPLLPRPPTRRADNRAIKIINNRIAVTGYEQAGEGDAKSEKMKTFDKFEDAQTILEAIYNNVYGYMIGGFHWRMQGYDERDFWQCSDARDMYAYWLKADKMIQDGRIFFVHPMKCKKDCPVRFQYGGYWACNSCNTHINTPDHWKIKVMQDGNAWCCIGNGFINLQESDNYAFGETRQQAIDNYEKLFYDLRPLHHRPAVPRSIIPRVHPRKRLHAAGRLANLVNDAL